jgi:hypothetical protein
MAITDPVKYKEWLLEQARLQRDRVEGNKSSGLMRELATKATTQSPELVTPSLGTPASGVLTNCTGLPTAGLATQVFAAGIGVGGKAAETGGVAFPASAVAVADVNTLDDYEEGTWTPTYTGLTVVPGTGGVTHTGAYTKIGRMVHVVLRIAVTGTATHASSLGNTYCNNLPFTAAAGHFHGGVTTSSLDDYGKCTVNGTTTNLYPPTWIATNITYVYLSAWYWV